MENRVIVANQIRTPDGTVIRSMHRHDYVSHLDANGKWYAVDGGQDYLRRTGDTRDCEDLSVFADDPFEKVRQYLCRGGRGKDGTQPLTCVPLNEMSDNWVKACIEYNEDRGMSDSYATIFYRKELEYRALHGITIPE